MAIKKESRRLHSPVKASSAKAAKHAAHLAPPEEQNGKQPDKASNNNQAPNNDGTIVVDTDKLTLPKGFNEDEKGGARLFGMSPVVLFVFCFALAFIAFIAYLISIETPAR